jgi:hypothetical protein
VAPTTTGVARRLLVRDRPDEDKSGAIDVFFSTPRFRPVFLGGRGEAWDGWPRAVSQPAAALLALTCVPTRRPFMCIDLTGRDDRSLRIKIFPDKKSPPDLSVVFGNQ